MASLPTCKFELSPLSGSLPFLILCLTPSLMSCLLWLLQPTPGGGVGWAAPREGAGAAGRAKGKGEVGMRFMLPTVTLGQRL